MDSASKTRLPLQVVQQQGRKFADAPELRGLLNAVPTVLMILNGQRQVVYANQSILQMLGLENLDEIFGQRPGEILDCEHASEADGGCGTTEACTLCGANNAICECQRGTASTRECRIIQRGGGALDLRVSATPLPLNGDIFTLLSVTDISHEKRRQALERIFFHDLMNTAGGLMGYAQLLARSNGDDSKELAQSIVRLAGTLVEEIREQRELAAAENNDLVVHWQPVSTPEILAATEQIYRNHEASLDRALRIAPDSSDATFKSDKTLLLRVLSNLARNAFEASSPGQTVTIGASASDDQVEFHVHNSGVIPRDVQLQIFQRSFSTKGPGRGLGAYSIKLLTERYLNGQVSFTSTPESGTTFRVAYPRQP